MLIYQEDASIGGSDTVFEPFKSSQEGPMRGEMKMNRKMKRHMQDKKGSETKKTKDCYFASRLTRKVAQGNYHSTHEMCLCCSWGCSLHVVSIVCCLKWFQAEKVYMIRVRQVAVEMGSFNEVLWGVKLSSDRDFAANEMPFSLVLGKTGCANLLSATITYISSTRVKLVL